MSLKPEWGMRVYPWWGTSLSGISGMESIEIADSADIKWIYWYDDCEDDTPWTYYESAAAFGGSWSTVSAYSPTHSFNLTFPSATGSNPGDNAGWYRTVTISGADLTKETYSIAVKRHDNKLGGSGGYVYHRIYFSGAVVFEQDVTLDLKDQWLDSGDNDITDQMISGTQTYTIKLELYHKNGVSNFSSNDYYDDVTIYKHLAGT